MARMGITRLADITKLDVLNVPVYQAVRPNSRNLSISQGKGMTASAAAVSALMEATELWHAEEFADRAGHWAIAKEVIPDLPYDLLTLPFRKPNLFHNDTPLEWTEATTIVSGTKTMLPKDMLNLDFTLGQVWQAPVFNRSSNGLCSGNTLCEAMAHGLCEVLERDSFARWRSGLATGTLVDWESVPDEGFAKMAHQIATTSSLQVYDITGRTGVPTFTAAVHSDLRPGRFWGAGAHLDSLVALCRAVTEAAQTRLAWISGARDDILDVTYAIRPMAAKAPAPALTPMPFTARTSNANEFIEEDVSRLAGLIHRATGAEPMVVDLTSAIDIPVCYVVAPGLDDEEPI